LFDGVDGVVCGSAFVCCNQNTVTLKCVLFVFSEYNQQDAIFLKFIYFCKTLYTFHTVFPSIIGNTKLHMQRQAFVRLLLLSAASLDGMEHPIQAVTVWQMPDAACAVLCSWWWMEKPSEMCRASYRNKWIWETLHLVGCTLRIY